MKIPAHINCNNCGDCCGPIMVTRDEKAKIKNFVDKMDKEVKARLKEQLKTKDRLTCQFRDIEKKNCAIYPIRPIICRIFGVAKGMYCSNGNTASIEFRDMIMKRKAEFIPNFLAD